MDLRLKLFTLALEMGDNEQVENWIEQIQKIEGPEGSLAMMGQAQHLTWQAERAIEKKKPAEATRLRIKAPYSLRAVGVSPPGPRNCSSGVR